MAPVFASYDVHVVALSKDSPSQVRAHRERDGLRLQLLADPELAVIRAFGLLHHKALEFKTWTLLGTPVGVPTRSTTMAIPTTLLVDEHGIVRWIDQADDYRIRGDEARVTQALRDTFGAR